MTPKLTLYALNKVLAPNPAKPMLLLQLLGIDYELKLLNFNSDDKATGVKGADYLAVCPNGRTPTLVDHSNNGFTVWESNAILEYIAEKYDSSNKLSSKDFDDKTLISQWLLFQASGHGPVQGNLYYASHYWKDTFGEPAPQSVITRFDKELHRVLDVYEHQLERQAKKHGAGNAFLVLDHLTIADISASCWLTRLPLLGIEMSKYPHIDAWMKKAFPDDAVKGMQKKFDSVSS